MKPIDKLAIGLNYYLATDRYTYLFGANDYKMKNINELNLQVGYTFNDTFGAYIKLNNVLNQQYEMYDVINFVVCKFWEAWGCEVPRFFMFLPEFPCFPAGWHVL